MKFPPLYKKTSTGADQVWNIGTEANVIVTTWGQVGGKMQEGRDTISQGKNLGKANETTTVQQAEAEAQSQWEKKVKKGYVEKLTDARAGKVDTSVIEGGIFPMLAHKFSEQGHKVKYPAFAQPKFDGHRCIAVVQNGEATLWSRTRKPITGLPHLVKALEEAAEKAYGEGADFILDGELYNHDYRNRFEELTSFIRNPEPKPGHEVVQFHVYDMPSCHAGFARRHEGLFEVLGDAAPEPLVAVKTVAVADEDELMLAFEGFLAEGYEGAMVRNAGGDYVNKRSYDLQKVKEFQDSEYPVIAVEEGRGKLAGHAIFVCRATNRPQDIMSMNDPTFKVKMKGETSELKKYFENPGLAIGRMLTVKYQGITNKTKVPRFPVGVRFREDV